MPAPMPRELPVTRAILPFSSCKSSGIACRRHADHGDGEKYCREALPTGVSARQALDAGGDNRRSSPGQEDVLGPAGGARMNEVPEDRAGDDRDHCGSYLRPEQTLCRCTVAREGKGGARPNDPRQNMEDEREHEGDWHGAPPC